MKFGNAMNERKVLAWAFYYLDYNGIKKLITVKANSTVEAQEQESNFVEVLEKEIQKINSFHGLKASELLHALKSIKRLIKGDDKSVNKSDPLFYQDILLQLDNVNIELIRFDDYKTINIAAWNKLLKKHDKHMASQLQSFWRIRMKKEPFVANHDALIDKLLLKMSKCYFLANQAREKELEASKPIGNDASKAQNFERTTTKYWVPADKVLLVKTEVLKHLPISSFNKKSSGLITSVYYDNPDLEIYHERLRREEGSIIIRMRTYNEGPHLSVYVERKVHHDSWVKEKSVKSRFIIKEKKLMKFLKGEYKIKDRLDKLLSKKEISQKDYDSTLSLANEIQNTVIKRKMEPTMTSRYDRTAFQLEGNATVRISLDGTFDLIREFGYKDNRWGRDLSNESNILDSEIHHFPHAILEIKLSLGEEESAPLWVQNLLSQDYVISCGKFSKFIHGCAVLIPRKVSLLPSWFPQLEATSDFRADERITNKRNTGKFPTIAYRTLSAQKKIPNEEDFSDAPIPVPLGSPKVDLVPIILPKPKEKENKNNKREDIELVTLKDTGKSLEEGKKQPNSSDSGNSKKGIFNLFNKGQKKVQANIKIEPKTYFANERTFLHWMSFLIFIEGVGFSLMTISTLAALRIGGLIFVLVALVFMIYSGAIFLLRRHRLRNKERGPYDEAIGPTLIVILLVIGILVTVILYFGGYTTPCRGTALLENNFYTYNPSEVIWDSNAKHLVIVGPDNVAYVNYKSGSTTNFIIGGDWEGVTQIPGDNSGTLYLAQEYPPSIHVVETSNFSVIRIIDTPLPGANASRGLEGLAYVPDDSALGGTFWCGSEMDGYIYIYSVDLSDSTSEPVLLESFQPVPNVGEIQALNYNSDSNVVYGIVGRRWIFMLDPTTYELLGFWGVGLGNPEGVTVVGSEIYVACDACTELWKFKFSTSKGIDSGKCNGVTNNYYPTSNSSHFSL